MNHDKLLLLMYERLCEHGTKADIDHNIVEMTLFDGMSLEDSLNELYEDVKEFYE